MTAPAHSAPAAAALVPGEKAAAFKELKCRQIACMLPTDSIRDREEGFVVAMSGATVRVAAAPRYWCHQRDGQVYDLGVLGSARSGVAYDEYAQGGRGAAPDSPASPPCTSAPDASNGSAPPGPRAGSAVEGGAEGPPQLARGL